MKKAVLGFMTSVSIYLFTGHLAAQVVTSQMPALPEPGEIEINTATLPSVATVLGQFVDQAVRQVEIRRLNPEQVNVKDVFLSTDLTKNVLVRVGRELPTGRETQVDFRTLDGQRFRLEREENGELRIGVRDAVLSRDDARALAKFLSDAGFSRVEIRALDRNGNQVRLELRDGLVKKEEIRPEERGRGREGTSASINNERGRDIGKDLDHSIRGRERAERERVERSGRSDRSERVERREGTDRPERAERSERLERAERPERSERIARPERIERAERIERPERVERVERAERIERPERVERVERPERVERIERPERIERIERPERSGRR